MLTWKQSWRLSVWFLATGIALGALGVRALSARQATPASPTRTMVLTVDLPEFPGKEARMWITELGPGIATPRHSHPGHLVGYVLEGDLSHRVDGQAPRAIKVGGAWEEHPGEVHVGANASPTTRLRLLAVGIYDKGAPLTNPAP